MQCCMRWFYESLRRLRGIWSQILSDLVWIASYGACLVGKMFLRYIIIDKIWPNGSFCRHFSTAFKFKKWLKTLLHETSEALYDYVWVGVCYWLGVCRLWRITTIRAWPLSSYKAGTQHPCIDHYVRRGRASVKPWPVSRVLYRPAAAALPKQIRDNQNSSLKDVFLTSTAARNSCSVRTRDPCWFSD